MVNNKESSFRNNRRAAVTGFDELFTNVTSPGEVEYDMGRTKTAKLMKRGGTSGEDELD